MKRVAFRFLDIFPALLESLTFFSCSSLSASRDTLFSELSAFIVALNLALVVSPLQERCVKLVLVYSIVLVPCCKYASCCGLAQPSIFFASFFAIIRLFWRHGNRKLRHYGRNKGIYHVGGPNIRHTRVKY